ncbi:MAG: 5'-deoxynucleotidase [Sinobacterium sp.]|nr:5'-deoxynucleotidase [Sinobacterium sp.]
MNSKFFAYLGRLKWIKRWGLMRNVEEENVMEHSWQVATIAHALALIHNARFNGNIDANAVATAALYHDVSEIITGDLPTPIKYHSEKIKEAYKQIESEAEDELLKLLPDYLQEAYRPLLQSHQIAEPIERLIKAADIISAYIKCQQEMAAGNNEFATAQKDLESRLRGLNMPEADEFMALFNDGYLLNLDELLSQHDRQLSSQLIRD